MDAKTERKARKVVNKQLAVICSLYHNGLPISMIDAILTAQGFNATEPGIYCGRDGHDHSQVGEKTWLTLNWHKMEVTGRYEITAYVS